MEVTRSNFNEILPQVEEAIKNATFLSIDCEMTGLNIVTDINSYDTIKTYYEKVRRDCKDFLVIQYGISAFRYEEDNNVFKQQSYSFYIFRRPVNRLVPDHRFLCQSSSIDFLICQDFDFNKLFKEGISYLTLEEETKYKEYLEERQKNRANVIISQQNGSENNRIPIPDDDKPFIDKVMKQIEEFINSDEKEIQLPRCNAFIRRLIYQITAEKFITDVSLETRIVDNDRILVATRAKTKEEKQLEEEQKKKEEQNEMEDAIGFSKILRMIVESDKLVVGHNLCLDILHSIDKFLTPLPRDYKEFKHCAHTLFSNILDTKYMSVKEPFKELIPSNVLKHMLETVLEKPFKVPHIEVEDDKKGYSLQDKKEHEAGYDAFITGVSFLSMWKYLGIKKSLPDAETFKNYNLLQPFMNRIYLMRLQDNQFIHLGGSDPYASREHVFYLTYPKEWKTNDIVQLFSPFGNVHVSWINEVSAYVGLYRKDQAKVALSTLSQSDTYTIRTFAKRQAELESISTPLSSPPNKQKRTKDSAPKEVKRRRTGVPVHLPLSPKAEIFPVAFQTGTYSKRYIEPIAEEQDQEEAEATDKDKSHGSSLVSSMTTGIKRKIDKTFEESASWE